jgi:hypothetical protein
MGKGRAKGKRVILKHGALWREGKNSGKGVL